MNPRIKLLFVVGTALTIGRALDLGLWTDLESGLCAVGPVWLRYAALAVGVLAAICIGRKLAHGPQELRNHCKASGTVTIMAGAFFALAALARLAVGLTGIGAVVRAVLEVLCAVWLVLLGRKWLRPDGRLPAKSMASGIWGTLVFYWCVLASFVLAFCWELPQTLTLAMPSQFKLTSLPAIFFGLGIACVGVLGVFAVVRIAAAAAFESRE